MNRRTSGFTLLEIMVVLAIIAILATLAWGAVASQQPRQRLVTAISDIRIAMLTSRTAAVKAGKYEKLCYWNDGAPFDDSPQGLMLRFECRALGTGGCAQENNVCQGSAASPTFKSGAVDSTKECTGTQPWCLRSGIDFGSPLGRTIGGIDIEGRGRDNVIINRFFLAATPGTEGTAAILEQTFSPSATVNEARTTTGGASGAVEVTNLDQCLTTTGSPTKPGAGCAMFKNRIRASYTLGAAVRIVE